MTDSTLRRQAVVVIHGVGEARPMATVRGFTAGIVSDQGKNAGYVSHPDRVSESSDLYTLRSPPRSAGHDGPVTDFYECYWANRMRDTKIGHVLPWVGRLAFTRPIGARPLVWCYWLVAWIALLVVALYGLNHIPQLRVVHATLTTGILGIITATIGGWLLQKYVLGYVGDAARYLTPDVNNIDQRAAIRKDARDLLLKLHKSERYDRIVVVGHSLGSVIAYDAVNRLWDEFRDDFGDKLRLHDPKRQDSGEIADLKKIVGLVTQEALSKVEDCGLKLRRTDPKEDIFETKQVEFHSCQADLWKEQRQIGNRWLITDLITLGSPLAHAKYLMRVGGDEFQAKVDSREFGLCPPWEDVWERTVKQRDPGRADRAIAYRPLSKDWIRIIIPSAAFGLVRWTNIYFPGDVIGGPVGHAFGPGVKDVRVRRNTRSPLGSRIRATYPTSHTKYWKVDRPANEGEKEKIDEGVLTALSATRKAIRLT